MPFTDFFKKRLNNNQTNNLGKANTYQLLSSLASETYTQAQVKLGPKVLVLGQLPGTQTPPPKLSEFIFKLFNLLVQTIGPEAARNTFEGTLNSLKNRYGDNQDYANLLKILPIPVMGSERLTKLNRAELENELLWRIKELENIRSNLELTVQQRTQTIMTERNKLDVALSGITDGVVAIDLNQKITIFNTASENLTGYTKAETIGQPIDSLIKVFDRTKELAPQEYCPINSAVETNFSKAGLKLVGKNGKESFVDLVYGQIRQGASVNLGCIITLHDVTKEKDLEEMKLDFVSMAAHELRTPLTSIRGYLSVFMQENAQSLNGEQNMLLGRINTASSQLMGLIENLLNVSKIERGAFTIQFAPLNWVETVKAAVEELKSRAEEKKQTLEFILPSQVIPNIEADKLRVTEVLTNLIANAISYTGEGGHITVWTESNETEVTTHVKDTGVGIPKEAISHLFTKFFRIAGNLEQGSKGTGLGLYISKSVMDMHHGKIWVDSELGKGSTFSFTLPITQEGKTI